jgi:hypothetical protein
MRTSAIGLFRSVIDRSRSAPSGSSAAAVRSPLPWGAIRCRGVRRPTGELVRGRSVVERLACDVGRRAGAKDAPLAMHEEGATRREMRGEASESTNRRNGRKRRTSSESCCSVGSIWSSCTDDSALLLRSRLAAPRRCTRCDLLNLPDPDRPTAALHARAPPQRTPSSCQCQRARSKGWRPEGAAVAQRQQQTSEAAGRSGRRAPSSRPLPTMRGSRPRARSLRACRCTPPPRWQHPALFLSARARALPWCSFHRGNRCAQITAAKRRRCAQSRTTPSA